MNQELTKLGLTDTEAKIYLAVLELGPSSAAMIAKQADVKRTTAYSALENLVKQGLLSEVADSKEKMFKAEDPDRLSKLTKKMRRQVIDAELELEKLLPGLKAIQKKLLQPPKVSFYQGMEGIKTIIEEFSGYPGSWYYFGSAKELIKVMSLKGANEFAAETRKFRQQVGRPITYMITDAAYYEIEIFKKPEPQVRQVRIFNNIEKAKSAFAIYGNKLGVLGVGDMPFGAVIESAEVAELVTMMFQVIWKSLPEESGL